MGGEHLKPVSLDSAVDPGTQLGPYEIKEPLGKGGMGEVYRAHDPELGRDVAIKLLPKELSNDEQRLARLRREARSLASLNHPGIAHVYGFEEHDGTRFIVMELVEGKTLAERLEGGPLPVKESLDLAVQIAWALEVAHEQGIVHRDLKPSNVKITPSGDAKVLDFGIAKPLREKSGEVAESELPTATVEGTRTGVVMGTAAYMSPEQAAGKDVDHRADQFTLGLVLYEMLAGRRPFEGETVPETLTALLRDDPEPLSRTAPEVPAPLRWIVERCLQREPADRYDSTGDLARDLDTLRSRLGELTGPGSAIEEEPPGRRFRAVPAAVVAGLLLAVATVAFFAGRTTHEAARLEYQRITFRRGTVSAARFEPGGESLLYSAAWEGRPSRVHLHPPEALDPIQIGPPDSRLLSVSSRGEILLITDLFPAGPFLQAGDLARMPVTGGPRYLDDNVADAAVGPDGEVAAVVREEQGRVVLEFPPGTPRLSTRGLVLDLRLSPDGDRVAFVETPGRGRNSGDIVVLDRGGEETRFDREAGRGLAWSPSGREIWFVEVADSSTVRSVGLDGRERSVATFPTEVFLFDISPEGRVLLSIGQQRYEMAGRPAAGEEERDLTWRGWSVPFDLTADGETILFNECVGAHCRVALRTFEQDPPVVLGDGFGVRLSPAGEWVVSAPPWSPREVALIATGTGEHRTTVVDGIDRIGIAAWSPDGEGLLLNGSLPGEGNRIFRLDLEDGELVPLTPEGIEFGFFAVSPDGRSLAAPRVEGGIAIYPIDGGEPALLDLDEQPIRWSADGRSLYTVPLAAVPATLRRIDIASRTAEVVASLQPPDPAGVVQISPVAVTPDGSAYVYGYVRRLADLFIVDGME